MLKQPSVGSVQWWQEQDLNRMFGNIILGPEFLLLLLLLTLYTLAKIYDNAAFKVLYSLITCEELIRWKRPWCWEGLGARGEGNDRGWDGWMASSTQWTWVWVNSGSWWRTREAWCAVIHGVVRSRTWLSDWIDWLTVSYSYCTQFSFIWTRSTEDVSIKESKKMSMLVAFFTIYSSETWSPEMFLEEQYYMWK